VPGGPGPFRMGRPFCFLLGSGTYHYRLLGGLGLFLQVPDHDVPATFAPANAVWGILIVPLLNQLERAKMVFGIVGLFVATGQ
jgi:hypothetical protein